MISDPLFLIGTCILAAYYYFLGRHHVNKKMEDQKREFGILLIQMNSSFANHMERTIRGIKMKYHNVFREAAKNHSYSECYHEFADFLEKEFPACGEDDEPATDNPS